MTDLEKMLFVRAKILEGNTKEQAAQAYRKHARLEKLNSVSLAVCSETTTPLASFLSHKPAKLNHYSG